MKPASNKTKTNLVLWAMFPVLLGVFLASFVFSALKTGNALNLKEGQESPLAQPANTATAKPRYFYVNKDVSGQPRVSARAFLVGDLNTGEVVLAKSQDQKYPVASVSKLMTALIASEMNGRDETAQVSKKAVATAGTNGELRTGEKIKISDLLYPLLLESSNDAAEALAEHFDRDSFIAKMNLQAEKLKMENTAYEDPSGLSINNQSTVSDMFKLAGYLWQNKQDLLEITEKRSYSNKKHNWSNISQFLGKEGYEGGKSGYTDEAKQTAVSVFSLSLGESGTRPIAITLLQSPDRRRDVENILKYLQKNIYYGGRADANTNWVQEKVGLPDIREPNYVVLTFGGDVMLDRGVENSVIKNFGNDYSALFEKLDIFKKSDIAFANLEGTASDQGADRKNLYSFRMSPSVIPALKGAGISILSLANNHVGDWGRPAYIDTLARLTENEIAYTGGGNNETEAETPVIIEKYGMKMGFLAFSDVGPDWMGADTEQAGLLLARDPRFEEIVQNATAQVDYLIVSFHFGEEYKPTHNARQEYLAHLAVDNGAKIVIGHHPHVTQDTEAYKNSFIAYSLGNLVFDQSWSQPTMQGMILEVKLGKDGSITTKKYATYLNSVFQLEKIIGGAEEKIKFQE